MSIPLGNYRTQLQGAAGNLRVASEFLIRGYNVSFPAVDMGVDLHVENVVRIQVKSAHMVRKPRYSSSSPAYCFFLARGPKALGGGLSSPMKVRIFSKVVDFVILWGIEQGRFWIIPAALLDGRSNVMLGLDARWVRADDQRIKELHDAGSTQAEIGAELGLSTMTVNRRLRGMYNRPPEFMADMCKIRDCEGKWELIEQYLATMQEASIASESGASSLSATSKRRIHRNAQQSA